MRPAEPGRRNLLGAGRRLLERGDLAKVSVNSITAEAFMAKGSFYQHWSSRQDYFVALHREFHDELTEEVIAATGGLRPGAERLTVGMHAYLDGCLAQPATKALLAQARTDAGLASEVAERDRQAATALASDLAAMGWSPAEPIATLLVAAIADIALKEVDGGRRTDLRDGVVRLASAAGGR